MVKVIYCDRCGAELIRIEKWQESPFPINQDFDIASGFSNLGTKTINGKTIIIPKKVIKVELCQNCLIGYNGIIDKINSDIMHYIDEGKKKTVNDKTPKADKKKKGWFS